MIPCWLRKLMDRRHRDEPVAVERRKARLETAKSAERILSNSIERFNRTLIGINARDLKRARIEK